MFKKAVKSNDIEETGDVLGGGALDSNVYKMVIEKAFGTISKGGAEALNLHLKGPKGITLRHQLWTASGDKKGNTNFYVNKKTGKKHYLPGFNIADAICELTIGKELHDLVLEKKTIKLYDSKTKKEEPTEVDMAVELLGQEIVLGVVKQVIDKTALNKATNVYEPTGDTREVNDIAAVFSVDEQLSVTEHRAKATQPGFIIKWVKKYKDTIQDRSTKTGITKGAPVSGAAPAAKDLF